LNSQYHSALCGEVIARHSATGAVTRELRPLLGLIPTYATGFPRISRTLMTQSGHWLAFYVAARSESQLYQNICLSRYDAVSSAAGGWPVNGAPPFSLPDARRQHRGSSVSPRGRPS